MARSSVGDMPAPVSPFQTPPGGMQPAPINPYGPPGWNGGITPKPVRTAPTVGGLLNALKRRWVMAVFLGGLVAAVVGVGIWLAMPPGKHTARALIEVRAKGSDLVHRYGEDFEAYKRNQLFLIKTRDLLTRVTSDPIVSSLDTVRSSDDPIKLLETEIRASTPAPEIIEVTMTGDNIDDMKTIVDNLVKKFLDDSNSLERRTRETQLKSLNKEVDKIRDEIRSKVRAIKLAATSGSTGGESAAIKQAKLQTEINIQDSEISKAVRDINKLKSNITFLQEQIKSNKFTLSDLDVSQATQQDPRILPLIQQRIIKGTALDRAKATATDDTAPVVLELQSQLKTLDEQIKERSAAIQPEVRALLELRAKLTAEAKLKESVDKLAREEHELVDAKNLRNLMQQNLGEGAAGDVDQGERLAELEPLRTQVALIQKEIQNLQLAQNLDGRLQLKAAAGVTLNQNLKQKSLFAGAGAFATFLLVVGLIGYLEWRTRRIDSVDQVVTDLGMRIIGTVPAFPTKANLKAAELSGSANWRFVLNESINSTRTMLLHTARNQSMQVVMVTSATQGEGKTSLTSQLATSMATAGMRTLIVDCDLRNPSIHKLFDLELGAGVSEVLCQEADVSEAVQPTSIPNLWVIPAGRCSNRVITALAQGHPLETLFNRLRGQFDFIIVDSCPVLPVADALLIGQHVDGVVFSIMHDISQLPKVLLASDRLTQLNIPLLGAVVNGIRSDVYSYGYNYVKQLPA